MMYLNRLVLRNFKKYRHAEIEFHGGLTGILGSNGSGKSTLVEAIAWALYGSRASGMNKEYIRNSRARESETVVVCLSMGLGRRELVIYRSMKGKNLSPEAVLMLDGRRIASGTREVDQRLEEMLKISYQDFMRTFYARQKDLDSLLREGGTGKREYLLKLLGLEDIRERALERIKADRTTLDDQRSRLAGALAEIGEVDERLREAAREVQIAEQGLEEARKRQLALEQSRDLRRSELEEQEEMRRSHELLCERKRSLEAQAQQRRQAIAYEARRLEEVRASRALLEGLQRPLSRLEAVMGRLDLLEPKRREHEEISRRIAAAEAALERERKALQESEEGLSQLKRDAQLFEELSAEEREYSRAEALMVGLERKRERHIGLQAELREELLRLKATVDGLVRVRDAIGELLEARARLEEILPSRDEASSLEREREILVELQERHRIREELSLRRREVQERLERLERERSAVSLELERLGDLDELEELLKKRDRELDLLGGELNRDLSALRGRREVAGFRRAEAQRSLVRVSALGGVCPTCERPLEEQRDLLVEKYEQAMQRAEEEIADLESRIKAQSERIEEVSRRRSGLRKEFEDLNERKSRRSGLQAGLRSLVSQISEAGSEIQDLCQRIEELGEDRFDQKRLEQVEASLRQLAPLVQEIGALEVRLGDLPRLEAERAALEGARAAHEGRALRIEGEIRDLGYDEKEHDRTRGLLAELRPIHERFLAVRERVQQIPSLEGRVSMQREEIERLARAIDLDRRALEILDFDPAEHRALLEESRSLSRVEKEAQRLRIILAAEPDIQRRLEEASKALASLESDLASTIDGLQATGYSQRAHEEARQALAEAERMADVASKEAFRWRESLGVLKDRIRRLQEASERRRGHERALSEVARRMEVVEATRTLVNMFMDGVLVRIRSEIARTAGEILDEVSGKYSLIKIDDDFNILVEDGGEYYPISRYSGGEIDMIAVSVRVAISEYLMRFGQERSSYSFLILDEIFGSQDPEHREKLIQMLRSLEDRFPQIIAISHISDVQGQFDNILQVVEDESGNSRVEAL